VDLGLLGILGILVYLGSLGNPEVLEYLGILEDL